MTASAALPRLRLRVRGVVQGVGFRPFAYGLAEKLGLSGFVRNDGEGVLIEVEGGGASRFVEALRDQAPPLARIDAVEMESCAALGPGRFEISASRGGTTRTRIGADAAVCEYCLSDLFDPSGRFFGYPLVNCTHCGPRYTITRALPYDRAQTAMAPFAMCPDCARDYADPRNRRFHAEPIACRVCGPKLDAVIDDIAACIARGGIAAVKGLGGFHLICDATNEAAVARLRRRKAREAKPFAVMVLNVASARMFAFVGEGERAAFEDRATPVVLMRRACRPRGGGDPGATYVRSPWVPAFAGTTVALPPCGETSSTDGGGVHPHPSPPPSRGREPARPLAPSIAPGLAHVGLMRAYTPLHWLILHALAGKPEFAGWRDEACGIALVATSANLAGEPLIADDARARSELADVADLVVGHERAIVARADDSVMRVLDGAPAYLRRARGVAPDPIDLGADGPSVIAQGGDLKNTVCITRGREAFVSPYLGDLDDRATIRFRAETIRHLQSLLGVEPEIVVCDLHPDFVSSRVNDGRPVVRVQHHVAHVAACAAEQGWTGPVLGVALDGFGLGTDGAAWGGELIALDGATWRRVGHLAPLALPGGDKAAREPWRMGVAALHELGRGAEAAARFPGEPEAGRLAQALARGARFGVTTSLGRVFDAAAALSGVCLRQAYEGEAAMRLEALVEALPEVARCWTLEEGRLDLTPLLAALPADAPREAAEMFHGGLVGALAEWIGATARAEGMARVVLGGGCVMNGVLTDGLCAALLAQGLVAAIPRALPANDGGLSFGQAAFALASLR